jgi:hypothetical protein
LATDIRGCADVSIICPRALPEYMYDLNTVRFSHEFRKPSKDFL